MSATEAPTIVTGVDFVSVPTADLERAVAFYGTTLGLPRSVHRPERNFAEFETGDVTLTVMDPEKMGVGSFKPNANHLALHVEDVTAARSQLAARGRARTVVALAPAGGWAPGDPAVAELFVRQREMHEALKAGAPHARGVPELLAHQMLGAASARGVPALVEHAQRSDWPLD